MSSNKVYRDSPIYRGLLNDLANGVGFKFSIDDVGKVGIDAPDIIFNDAQKAKALGITLDEAFHPTAISSNLQVIVDKLHQEAKARQLQSASEALREDVVFVVKPEARAEKLGLTPPYTKYYEHLQQIAKYTAFLQVLEKDLRGIRHYSEICAGEADPTGQLCRLFIRQFSVEGCGPYVKDPYCSPHPDFVVADANGTAWPDDMTDAEFAGLEKKLSPELYKAVMSNYTVVERDGESFVATPYVKFDSYDWYLSKIAAEFDAIASMEGIDEASKKTASAYARACRGEGANPLRPFDEAEEVWATSQFPVLTFTFGPFEEHPDLDHFGVKRGFQMTIYRVKPELTGALEQDRPMIGLVNEVLRSKGVKIPKEAPRRQVIHVTDVVYSSFKMSHGHATAFAQTIPNDGPVVDKYGRRVDTIVNLAEAIFDRVLVHIRDRVIAPSQRKFVKKEMVGKFAELHELMHSAGVLPDHKIGEKTVYEAIGPLYYLLDESKADTMTLIGKPLVPVYDNNALTDYAVTYVSNLMRLVRMPKDLPHTWGARAQLGFLFRRGVVSLREEYDDSLGRKEKFLYTDTDRLYKEIGEFSVGLSNAVLSGIKAEAKKFIQQDFDKIPEELTAWVSYPASPTGRLNGVPMGLIVDTGDPF